MAKRARAAERHGLYLKGSGLVFVATKGGDIRGPSRRGAGLYAWDTRHLSRYEVRPGGGALRLRSAEVLPDGARLDYGLGRGVQVERRLRIDSKIEDEWTVANTGPRVATFDAELLADADFRDLFEVRRRLRTTRGRSHQPTADGGTLRLGYTAVDGVQHTTEIDAPAKAWRVARKPARSRVKAVVAPGDRRSLRVEIRVRSSLAAPKLGKRDWRAWEK